MTRYFFLGATFFEAFFEIVAFFNGTAALLAAA